jgi:tetratricopeptide (TPR) repeat protein
LSTDEPPILDYGRPATRLSRPWLLALLLLVLTLLAYLPVLHGGFIWDDDDYVTSNLALLTPHGLLDIWLHPRATPQYYPIVFTSFWIEHALWGFNPTGYHTVNVFLHVCAAILLWRVLDQLDLPPPASLIAACVFAVHPSNVESVAWITERKNVLSAVFYFASALLFLRGRHALAVLLFIAALLSKSVTCSLPAALLLVLWWKHKTPTRRDGIVLALMFALGIGLAINTALLERSQVSAVGLEWNYSLADRLLIAGRAVWFYFTMILLPTNLSFVYAKWPIAPSQFWQWTFPLGVVIALVALYLQRDRWGRGPLVAALFFTGTLVPALGFFNIYPMRYTFVADHYAYIASVGVITALAVALHRLRRVVPVIMVAILILLTMMRAAVFRDVERLWTDTLAKNPDSWMVHLNLAKVVDARSFALGHGAEAESHFRRAVELGPDVPDTHMDLGTYLANHNRLGDAVVEYDRALALNPNLPQVHYHLGRAYQRAGMRDPAIAEYERALQLRSDYPAAHLWLALALMEAGRSAEAKVHADAVIRLDPDLARQFRLIP